MKKKYLFILSTAAVFIILLSQILSAQEKKSYDFNDFKVVSVGWGMHLDIKQSDTYSIQIEADEKDFEYLRVEKKGDGLKVYIDRDNYRKRGDIYVTIQMPKLTGLNLSGGSKGNIQMNVQDNFGMNLSGGSILKGSLSCGDLGMNLSGGSKIDLNGSGREISLNASGGSTLDMKQFAITDLNANLSGGSMISVKMDGEINVKASGGSKITYYGNAKIGSRQFSGGSQIVKGD